MKHCASFLILFMPLIAFATGCETGTPTGKVTGEVTYNGEPIPNGTVVFEVSGARPATAKIDQGQLVDMETGKPGIDVPVGTAKIAVFATEVAPESEEAETSPADPGGGGVDNRSNYMGMGAASLIPQGQRTLSSFAGKDLHQEVDAPARHAAFHDIAVFAGVLLDQAQRHPT